MKMKYFLFVTFLLIISMNCSTDSPTSPRVFTDSLTLGTGSHGIDLTGATDTFTIARTQGQDVFPTIYWRAESKSKMAGEFVDIKVERMAEIGPEEVYINRYTMIRLDDYVAISSYFHMYGAGNFRATAVLGQDKRLLGVMLFTVRQAG